WNEPLHPGADTTATPGAVMTRPTRYLAWMAVGLVAAAALAILLHEQLYNAYQHNPGLNFGIFVVFLIGVAYIFWQVLRLNREITWIERCRTGQMESTNYRPPRLLAPMAAMIGARKGGKLSLSALSLRSVLDGINARLDESHDIARYFIGLMVFLGLLGTFWGLLKTIGGVADTPSPISVSGGAHDLFTQLKAGLHAPLPRLGTALRPSPL